jgi:nitrogen fixation/metabolism regulation signal transduction histidine kinase
MLIKKLREPLNYLIETIKKIKPGSQVVEEKIFYSDELGLMTNEFFSMRKIIQEKIDKQIKAEEKTRLLLTSVGEGIFGVGNDGLVNFINPAALEILQYKEEEIGSSEE